MKKILLSVLFVSLAACSSGLSEFPTSTPSVSQLTVVTDQAQMAPDKIASEPILTETPISTLTSSPSQTPTLSVDDIVERPYDPDEWVVLYDKNTVSYVEVEPTGRMWISPGEDVGYFDGSQWVFFSPEDYLLFPFNNGMAIAPDGTVWVSGTQELSRYSDGRWENFPIPDACDKSYPGMRIDSNGAVWISMSSCPDNVHLLKKFDGKKWSDVPLWTTEIRTLAPSIILFTPDGFLWVADNTGDIGRYDGKTWKIFSKTDIWPPHEWSQVIQIVSDHNGNIYGIYTGQSGKLSWILKIDTNGQATKIPFPTILSFNVFFQRLFVDSQNTIWVNACLDDISDTCLAYYKDNQWVSFTGLPNNLRMLDMHELQDGTFLIASFQGLYQFKPIE